MHLFSDFDWFQCFDHTCKLSCHIADSKIIIFYTSFCQLKWCFFTSEISYKSTFQVIEILFTNGISEFFLDPVKNIFQILMAESQIFTLKITTFDFE